MNNTRAIHRALTIGALCCLCSAWLSCTADFPPGVIACNGPSDCPKGQSCRIEGEAGEGLCFPGAAGDVGAPEPEVSLSDAAIDATTDGPPYEGDGGRAGMRSGMNTGKPRAGAGGSAGSRPAAGGAAGPSAAGRGGSGARGGASGGAGRGGVSGGSTGRSGASGGRAGAGGAVTAGTPSPDVPAAGSGGHAGRPSPPAPCDNPARECSAGATDMGSVGCGPCDKGMQMRARECDPATCTWRAWSNVGACSDAAPCSPGDTTPGTRACGACGTGTQMTVQTCSDACEWAAPVDMGACADPAQCTPNFTEPRTIDCTLPSGCGRKDQARVCSPTTCTFGEWADTSSCPPCGDCAEVVYCDTPDNVAPNRGTWCKPLAPCTPDQASAACLDILATISCSLHEPYYVGN